MLDNGQALLSRRETLAPDDSKRILSFPFQVAPHTKALAIRIGWTPRFSTDLEANRKAVEKAVDEWLRPAHQPDRDQELPTDIQRYVPKIPNLLNAVLVDPDGNWRGRTDRGRGQKKPLILSADCAPLGFVPGPIMPGTWRFDVEVHAVVPPDCTLEVEITACDPPESPSVDASDPPWTAPASPPGWYRGELHSHTVHSDGGYSAEKLVRRASELGLDFLALTDHNTLAGADPLAAAPFPTIQGVELTTFHGHHVVLGAREMVPWHEGGERLDINVVAERFRSQGALFTLSHPFSIGDPVCTGCRWETPELDPENIDLVEIWHRRWTGERGDNRSALNLWTDLWRRGHRPTAIGVRDWHTAEHEATLPGDLPTTVIGSRSLRQDDLLDGLRAGAAYVTVGPSLRYCLHTSAGARVEPGEHGAASPGPLTAEVEIERVAPTTGESPVEMVLLRSGCEVDRKPIGGSGTVHLEEPVGGAGWYRIEVWQGDTPLAITNHIEVS